MFKKLNNFFSIENKEEREYQKSRLKDRSQIEKYKSEIL
jgi:hypothetical protein